MSIISDFKKQATANQVALARYLRRLLQGNDKNRGALMGLWAHCKAPHHGSERLNKIMAKILEQAGYDACATKAHFPTVHDDARDLIEEIMGAMQSGKSPESYKAKINLMIGRLDTEGFLLSLPEKDFKLSA